MDFMKMLGQLKELDSKMKEAKEKLGKLTAEAESGGGMVKVRVNGNKVLEKVEIDPSLMTPADREMLQDLVTAAVNIALREVSEKAEEVIKQHTMGGMKDLGFPFPM